MPRTLHQTVRRITRHSGFWGVGTILIGASISVLVSIEVALAWAVGGLVMVLALFVQNRLICSHGAQLAKGILAKWLTIGLGFSAVFLGWQSVELVPFIGGALVVNLARPLSALSVSLKRRSAAKRQ
jgi:type IV secretory pathway VirB3-like protein